MVTEDDDRWNDTPADPSKGNLSDEWSDADALTDFELRCALHPEEELPDVEAELERFREQHLVPRKMNTRYYRWIVAAAACLAIAILMTWLGGRETDRMMTADSELSGTFDSLTYYSPAPMTKIALSVGDEELLLNSEKAKQQGVEITQDNVIRFLSPENVSPEDRNTITIPQGQLAQVLLPDGSKVYLSAFSRLIFPQKFLNDRPREVRLIGEGYFEVARDESRPFIVHSGHLQTRVLGTVFNIRHFEGEPVQVTLVSGSVEVSLPQSSTGQRMVLKPGQQASAKFGQQSISLTTASMDEVLSWKEGLFCFGKRPLKEVLTEIARWYCLNMRFANKEQMNQEIHYNGERSWSIEQVIEQLNDICDSEIKLIDNTLVVN
ncbi:MAG: FecR domain-containing protein [Prevotella sp.]|nr:FecR domain-containing protein [Prevotella sp.]MBP3827874.1 FecR domain-containing protein [Prevotella sp.]MBQ6033753.1 FecR domain-containing protein [Prevotella sp.]